MASQTIVQTFSSSIVEEFTESPTLTLGDLGSEFMDLVASVSLNDAPDFAMSFPTDSSSIVLVWKD